MKLRMILAVAALAALTSLPIAANAQNWHGGNDRQMQSNRQSNRGSQRGAYGKSQGDRTWNSKSNDERGWSGGDNADRGYNRRPTPSSFGHNADPGVRYESPYTSGHKSARHGTMRHGG